MYSADQVQEWPCDVDPQGVWIVDTCVPQEKLGRGVVEFKVSVTSTSSLPSSGRSSSSSGLQPLAANVPTALVDSSVAATPTTSVVASTAAASQPQPKSERMLKRNISVPDDDTAAEQMAKDTKKAFQLGKLVSADTHDPTTAEFWTRYVHARQGPPQHFQGPARKIYRQLGLVRVPVLQVRHNEIARGRCRSRMFDRMLIGC